MVKAQGYETDLTMIDTVFLPYLNGFKLYEALKHLSKTQDIKVIFLSNDEDALKEQNGAYYVINLTRFIKIRNFY